VWPFVLGGDNSVENLRVVTKDYNLSQGAKRPGLLDLLGHSPKLHLESGRPSEETVSGLEPERTPRRLRFVGRILLVAAILGFCWYHARNQKPRAPSEATSRRKHDFSRASDPNCRCGTNAANWPIRGIDRCANAPATLPKSR